MKIDDVVLLIDSATKLLSVLVWPSVLVFTMLRFGQHLEGFLASLEELTLKGAGLEASLKKKQAEVTAALVAAAATKKPTKANQLDVATEDVAAEADQAVKIVAESVTSHVVRQAEQVRILWVDDNPDNNLYARRALEKLGIRFALATSTDEALKLISMHSFDLIISDMGRPPDSRAGYTLLDQLRRNGNSIPFIIYASSRAPEHIAESRRHGAIGCTNNANELFQMVLTALRNNPRKR